MSGMSDFISGLGRRQFVSRVLAGGGAFAAGVLRFSTDAAAHTERLSMAAAQLSRPFGIATYRVRLSDDNLSDRIVADLLDDSGNKLGEFARTRLFTKQIVEVYAKDEEVTLDKFNKRKEELQFIWGSEYVDLIADRTQTTLDVKYNNQWIGTVTDKDNRAKKHQAALSAFLQQRSELLTMIADVGRDLDAAFPKPPRVAPGCCCSVGCPGIATSCWDYGPTRSTACEGAIDCLQSDCWNQYCVGCCYINTNCDCACFPGTDFLCTCISHGQACDCFQQCV